jgi:hypothetical protein
MYANELSSEEKVKHLRLKLAVLEAEEDEQEQAVAALLRFEYRMGLRELDDTMRAILEEPEAKDYKFTMNEINPQISFNIYNALQLAKDVFEGWFIVMWDCIREAYEFKAETEEGERIDRYFPDYEDLLKYIERGVWL